MTHKIIHGGANGRTAEISLRADSWLSNRQRWSWNAKILVAMPIYVSVRSDRETPRGDFNESKTPKPVLCVSAKHFPTKSLYRLRRRRACTCKGRHFFSFMMQRTAVSSAVLVTTITSPHMLSIDPRKGYQSAKSVTSFGLRAIIDDQMQIPSKSRAITVKWRVLEWKNGLKNVIDIIIHPFVGSSLN